MHLDQRHTLLPGQHSVVKGKLFSVGPEKWCDISHFLFIYLFIDQKFWILNQRNGGGVAALMLTPQLGLLKFIPQDTLAKPQLHHAKRNWTKESAVRRHPPSLTSSMNLPQTGKAAPSYQSYTRISKMLRGSPLLLLHVTLTLDIFEPIYAKKRIFHLCVVSAVWGGGRLALK